MLVPLDFSPNLHHTSTLEHAEADEADCSSTRIPLHTLQIFGLRLSIAEFRVLCQWKVCKLSLHYLDMMRCLVLLCVTTVLALRSESFGAVNHESVEAHKAANEHKAEGSERPGCCQGLRNKGRKGLQRSVKLHMVQTSMAWWLQQTPVMLVKNGQDVSRHALHSLSSHTFSSSSSDAQSNILGAFLLTASHFPGNAGVASTFRWRFMEPFWETQKQRTQVL